MYVSLDFSSPFVPGAFNFNPDESVDGVARHRESVERQLTVSPAEPARLDVARGAPPRTSFMSLVDRPRALNEWLVDVRRTHAPVPEASTLSEDH